MRALFERRLSHLCQARLTWYRKLLEARDIAGDPVIREVPAQLRRQGGPLLLDREVAVLAAPLPPPTSGIGGSGPSAVLRFTAQFPLSVRPQ